MASADDHRAIGEAGIVAFLNGSIESVAVEVRDVQRGQLGVENQPRGAAARAAHGRGGVARLTPRGVAVSAEPNHRASLNLEASRSIFAHIYGGLVSACHMAHDSVCLGRCRERITEMKTVLIVEDNELNMKLFHDLLESKGYNILQTREGLDALRLARKHRPDLILMDIQLPEVSGLEVTKWIKEDDDLKSIPVIAVTAFAMKGDEEKIREGGCEAYIAKPISVSSFLATISRFLD
jgi:two-component system cell cycle response regulator DivK